MKTIHVSTGSPYDIMIERGILDNCGEIIKKLSNAEKITIVTDTNVAPLYKWRVLNSLSQQGYQTTAHVFQAGEQSKNLNTIATYLRGIDFVQIPTSLLAQVDSSVGGKTGVDIAQGKNLVGAFYQPKAVLIDPDTLSTLPDQFITDGMAEVIKYGCIKDSEFFEMLANGDALEHIDDVIETCVKIKRDVVNRDEKEAGERMLLNFGHTLGHAIEKIYNYTGITHGMAVAVGMVMMTKASEKHGLTEAGTAYKIEEVCATYGLPTTDEASLENIAEAAQTDKKTSGSSINVVLLEKIGTSFTKKVAISDLLDFITP